MLKPSDTQQGAVDIIGEDRQQEIADLCVRVFGKAPARIAFPGGKTRAAYFVDMGGRTYVVAKRDKIEDARWEADLLETFGKTGYVPRLKAWSGRWIVQEHVAGVRLPVLLDQLDTMDEREKAVEIALDGLLNIHETAHSQGYANRLAVIGADREWYWNRTGAAKRMSQDIDIEPPAIDRDFMVKVMFGKRDDFIKYDARPGNVLINGDKACWFDWEDFGRGCAVEDLAFVFCDEWMALDAETEGRLINEYLPLFNRTLSNGEAQQHLLVYGVMHTIIRLRMALKYNLRDGRWWDREYCLSGDKVGNTANETARLCDRGQRWADQIMELRPLVEWLDNVKDHFNIPDLKGI